MTEVQFWSGVNSPVFVLEAVGLGMRREVLGGGGGALTDANGRGLEAVELVDFLSDRDEGYEVVGRVGYDG
jgi:hypothetical protein